MWLEEIVAGYGLLAVILYAVLGGADFGGGIWDLFATGPRRQQQRDAIAAAMGPVWEANHVWLIFVIVVLFTGFPAAFAYLSVALFIPFHLVLVGITLRGAAFVFRGPKQAVPSSDPWAVVFGAASTFTPLLLGLCLGAVSAGDLHITRPGDPAPSVVPAWLTPVSMVIGCLALALCAYLAAVYLTNETAGQLREDFRYRALLAGTAVVALAAAAIPVTYWQAPELWRGLFTRRAVPVLAAGASFALLSGWTLLRRRYRLARVSAVAQVVFLLLGWGLVQYPYVVYPDVTMPAAAAPAATLEFMAVTVPFGLLVFIPSLWLLFRVFKAQ